MPPAGASQLAIGSIVDGKYAIESRLGEGGMGIVYLARDIHLETPVVLKGIRPELAQNKEFRARILAEGRAMAKIDHENVVRLNSVVVRPDELFLVMQYVDGESLEQTIAKYAARGSFMPVGEVIRLLDQVLAGVGAAHAEGMIHRDIKPANILIRRKDSKVRVTDFGIAKAEDETLAGQGLTRTYGLVGSVLYMSPEQIRGQRDLDRRVDIYSLGIMLFEMLAGWVPFEGTTTYTTMHMHVGEPIPSIALVRPDVPDYLRLVIEKACAKSPDFRFGSAEEMAAALSSPTSQVQRPAAPNSMPISSVYRGGPANAQAPMLDVPAAPIPEVPQKAESTTDGAMETYLASGPSFVSLLRAREDRSRVCPTPYIKWGDYREPNLVGTVVDGRYRIESLRSDSRLGRVYLARDDRMNAPVVIVRIRDEMASNSDFKNRVLPEARAIRAIEHKNVVRLVRIMGTDRSAFFVWVFVEGVFLSDTIRDYAKQICQIPLAPAYRIFSQILAGVHAAHEAGIVHGSIDPTSVLVRASDTLTKVANFGIERAIDDIFGNRAEYALGEAHEHMFYMAPERLVCHQNLDCRADIYSLGVLLFVMLTGTSPFPSETLFKSEDSADWRIPSLTLLRPDAPAHIQSVIEIACARDRASRFGSVPEMAGALLGDIDVSLDELDHPTTSEPPAPSASAHSNG